MRIRDFTGNNSDTPVDSPRYSYIARCSLLYTCLRIRVAKKMYTYIYVYNMRISTNAIACIRDRSLTRARRGPLLPPLPGHRPGYSSICVANRLGLSQQRRQRSLANSQIPFINNTVIMYSAGFARTGFTGEVKLAIVRQLRGAGTPRDNFENGENVGVAKAIAFLPTTFRRNGEVACCQN